MGRARLIYGIVIMLLIMIFLTSISVTTAISLKFRKYSVFSKFFNQSGVLIKSYYLQRGEEENALLYRDALELKEELQGAKDVLSVSYLWEPYILEKNLSLSVWCYSVEVVDALSPVMKEGRWFQASDTESDILKAVVSYNQGELQVGDTVTITSNVGEGTESRVEIIGVMENDENIFSANISDNMTEDYRECYYTYDYDFEDGNILMLLSDAQILNGEKSGMFDSLNFRIGEQNHGFQKQMCGATIITFDESVTKEEIDSMIEKLKQRSGIKNVYDLSDIRENSLAYIFSELNIYFPVFICIFIFVIVAAISANVVLTKRQLKNYAIYYLCGLTWKQCAQMSLVISCILVFVAYIFIAVSVGILSGVHVIKDISMFLGVYQFGIVLVISVIFIGLAWFIPYRITCSHSALEVMVDNKS